MEYLPNGRQMKQCDQYTIEKLGVSSAELMERAAKSCVEIMITERMDLTNVWIVCGSGNNGGDGFAIARFLRGLKKTVSVVFAGTTEHCTKETAQQRRLYEEAGGTVLNDYEAGEYSVIVDALLGIGLTRKVEGRYRTLIAAMNASKGCKVAVDLPSGIMASTGCVMGEAFQADLTVTFQCRKLGMMLYPGCSFCGTVHVADIGIAISLLQQDRETACTCGPEEFRERMPKRLPDSHKGTYGKVLVIAGSEGMAGAAYLNALAAYRAGAGLVQIYTVEANRVILQQLLPEAIVSTYERYDERTLLELLLWADAVCIGSGMGRGKKAEKIVLAVLAHVQVPCVVDADALNILSGHMEKLEMLRADRFIFTPHLKEMSRLIKKEVLKLKEDKIKTVTEAAEKYPVTWVLKDARTVIAKRGNHPHVNLSGNAALAKAGSGDVLTGIIAACLAQGMDCYLASVFGVYLHGLAGDEAKKEMGSFGVLARELADYTGVALKKQEEQLDESL